MGGLVTLMKRHATSTLIGISFVAVVSAAAWISTEDRREPASKSAMYRHRIAILTDQEIMELKAESRTLASRQRQRSEQEHMERIGSTAKSCGDEAYAARNREQCSNSSILILLASKPEAVSEEAVFERLVIGNCIYASTVHIAKQMNCL